MQWLKNTFTGLDMDPMEIGFTVTMPCALKPHCYATFLAVLVLQEHGARGVDGLPESQEKKLFEMLLPCTCSKKEMTWQ